MTLPTLLCALRLYLRWPLLDEVEWELLDFFFGELERDVPRCEDLLRLELAVDRRRLPEPVLLRRPACELLARRVLELDLRAVDMNL